jgi:hypothetical protein
MAETLGMSKSSVSAEAIGAREEELRKLCERRWDGIGFLVCRWRDGRIVLRWVVSAYRMTERNFRRIECYRDLWMLKAALDPSARKNQTSLDQVAQNALHRRPPPTEPRTPSRRKMGESGGKRIEEELAWKYSVPKLLAAYQEAFRKA